jgi:signal transduction histidine kinase
MFAPQPETRLAGFFVVRSDKNYQQLSRFKLANLSSDSLRVRRIECGNSMQAAELFRRYQDLQLYVGWTGADEERIRAVAPLVERHFPSLIDDFYAEIQRHPDARRVITGGEQQIERLKKTFLQWLHELFFSPYDAEYVARRWRVGYRHVLIGLDQVYTNAAISRLRRGLSQVLETTISESPAERSGMNAALDKLLDLDLAIIELSYQTAFIERQQVIERLAAIGQVAGGVAHELRNPLNVVKTSVYYLLNAKNPTAEKVAEHLKRIERQVGMADGVITALNEFAKLPLPVLEPMPLVAQLKEILELNPLPEEIEVVLDIPASVPPVLADRGQIKIVFGNLIRNAREAMPAGGRLAITAASVNNQVDIRIADTGGGIHSEDLQRIMEPLFTTKARGIGLGLAITRAIVDKHNGKLKVESQPGQGSTFCVTLTAAVEEVSRRQEAGGSRD